jgi:hypothetical protein
VFAGAAPGQVRVITETDIFKILVDLLGTRRVCV